MSSLCVAATIAAGGSVTMRNGSLVLVAPKVVISRADAAAISQAMLSSTWPDHALLSREIAQQRGVRVVWDPWARFAQGAVLPGGVRPNMPQGCPIPMAAPGAAFGVAVPTSAPAPAPPPASAPVPLPTVQSTVGSRLIARPIATSLATTIGMIALGGVGLVAFGLIGYFVLRD